MGLAHERQRLVENVKGVARHVGAGPCACPSVRWGNHRGLPLQSEAEARQRRIFKPTPYRLRRIFMSRSVGNAAQMTGSDLFFKQTRSSAAGTEPLLVPVQ